MSNKTEPKYTILYQTGTPMARTAETILCWGFLGFLVWLGRDSTWWTFVFGTVAIFGIAGRFKYIYDNYTKRFHTKAELVKFVGSLPEDGTDL